MDLRVFAYVCIGMLCMYANVLENLMPKWCLHFAKFTPLLSQPPRCAETNIQTDERAVHVAAIFAVLLCIFTALEGGEQDRRARTTREVCMSACQPLSVCGAVFSPCGCKMPSIEKPFLFAATIDFWCVALSLPHSPRPCLSLCLCLCRCRALDPCACGRVPVAGSRGAVDAGLRAEQSFVRWASARGSDDSHAQGTASRHRGQVCSRS